jgi:SAM-dependent methyltransferase
VDGTRRYYDQQALAYRDRTARLDLAAMRSELVTRVAPGARVLDAGCGAGRDVVAFTGAGLRAVGLDLSLPLLACAREATPGAPLAQADLRALPFAGGAFAGLWMCASLLHLPAADAPLALREAARVLAPGGVAVLTLKEGEGARTQEDGRRFTYWTGEAAAGLLRAARFEDVVVTRSGSADGGERSWLTVVAVRAAR